jgi:hypothetical protein
VGAPPFTGELSAKPTEGAATSSEPASAPSAVPSGRHLPRFTEEEPEPAAALRPSLVVIACGALAREVKAVVERNGLESIKLACIPAQLHNRPNLIPDAVRKKIAELRPLGAPIFCAYGDCGTGGELDRVLLTEGVERLPGAHCYAFYSGLEDFGAMHDEEPGTFYLTDFLARHFDRLIVKGLGLDRHPQLFDDYFRNYRRVVWLAQSPSDDLAERARRAAAFLKLPLVVHQTGFGLLETELLRKAG